MRQSVQDITLDPVTEGMIASGVLSHYVSPKGAVSYSENLHNDTLGILTSRRPLVSRHTPAASVLSCVLYQNPSSSQVIVWQEGTTIKWANITSGSITTHAASSSANRNRYDIIQGKVIMTNDTIGQPKLFDTTGAPTAIAGTGFPGAGGTMDLISAGFSGRIWGAASNDSTCKVYYSDVIPVGGVASTTGGGSYLTINANNGDRITGFARTQNVLYVFTHNGIFRVYNTQSQDNTPIANVGAFQQEGIVRAKNGFYFYHPSGVYFIGSNGFPQEISVKIRDIIQKVPSIYQTNVFGWADDDHVFFCLGNKLSGCQADKTYYIRYTISTQVWTIMSTLQFLPTCADGAFFASGVGMTEDIYPTNYLIGSGTDTTGTANSTYYGGTLNVFTPSTENSAVTPDWGTIPTHIDMQTNWWTGDIEHHIKRINGIAFPSENGAGLKVAYQIDKDPPNDWRELTPGASSLSSNYITLFRPFQSEKFNRIKFRVFGDTKGVTVKLAMPTFLQVDDLGFEEN